MPGPQLPALYRMNLVGLAKDSNHVKKIVVQFRQHVERELLDAGGGGIVATSLVHTAALSLRRHLEAERKLQALKDSLTLEQWQNLCDRSIKWKQGVDKALVGLGLDKRQTTDVWEQIYNPQRLPHQQGNASPQAAEPEQAEEETEPEEGEPEEETGAQT
jgi:hypothetical protein